MGDDPGPPGFSGSLAPALSGAKEVEGGVREGRNFDRQ
jgi:hypothetical protein